MRDFQNIQLWINKKIDKKINKQLFIIKTLNNLARKYASDQINHENNSNDIDGFLSFCVIHWLFKC